MRNSKFCAALALLALCGGAFAQSGATFKWHCNVVGSNSPEPLGDRDGHSVSTVDFACRGEGGPWDGGVLTGSTIYEWNGPNASGWSMGIARKPGATAVYVNGETRNTLKMADGKVTGFDASGRGSYPMATGSAASYAGKTYTYTARPTGAGQFVIEVKAD